MRTGYLITAAVAAFFLAGCGNSPQEKLRDAKADYVQKTNEVEVMTLERTDFARQLLSNGKLKAARRSELSFRSNGPLAAVNFKNGDFAPRGATIASLDRKDLLLQRESASISLQKAELDLYDFLAGLGYPSRDTLSVPADILSTAKTKSGYTTAKNAFAMADYEYEGSILRAPFAGRVADIRLGAHELAGSGPFCILVDDSVLEVAFNVMESEYSFLEKGLSVSVSPFSDPSRSYAGKITDINPLVDANGQISVKASIRNDGTLIDGMNVKVIVERTIPSMLVVPRSSVVIRDNLDVLFTYNDGKAGWTYVNILQANSTHLAVEANTGRGAVLNPGDLVIISGNLNLADKSSVVIKKR